MRTRLLLFGSVLFLAAAVFCVGLLGCSDEKPAQDSSATSSEVRGFTFFELTSASRFSSELRSDLEKRLGSDGISRRSPLDLEIPPQDFVKTHFPRVHALNSRLNFSPRERIEHNITRLMYRYPEKKQLPFSFVELVFSNYNDKPLVFHTTAKEEGATVIQTLRDKYGKPSAAQWDDGNQKALFWRKPGELMVVYALRDRFGNPEYQVQLLFLENIEELVRTEEKEREASDREKKKAVRDAF